MPDSLSPKDRIAAIAGSVAEEFEVTRRILSFDEWFELLCLTPQIHARNAAQYLRDAFNFFGRREVRNPGGKINRFRLFDCEFDGGHRLVGQEAAQCELFEAIEGFVRVGRVNKLLLLHGPNGSAKTTMLEALHRALEAYSRSESGALYRFSWVFPTKVASRGSIGFGLADYVGPGGAFSEGSFARLRTEAIDAKIGDEVKDPPLFLIPLAEREELLRGLCADDDDFVLSDLVLRGDLSQRNRRIFDGLLASYRGELAKVYQHIQVERLFLSRTYRSGLVTVEPKQAVDARSFPVTGDRSFSNLPASVGGQVLYACQGDLVDANRGVINYSDLLKRPYEHYKYLLTATESGKVALDHVMLGLDVVFTGSANDLNLLEFRTLRPGEYQSLRGRLELIAVPYLLDYRVERRVYQEQVGDLLRGIHIAPHVTAILALWGVMTRLRAPNPENYPEKLATVLRRLTPLEKADLYSYGRVPSGLTSEEARELLAAVPQMYEERFPMAVVGEQPLGDYEGSFGASVRDLKRLLLAVASEPGMRSITVPKLFRELHRYCGDAAQHRWMGLEPQTAGFHSLHGNTSVTAAAWERWLDLSDREIREAMGLVDEERYLDLFRKYVVHVSHFIKRERLFDPVTGVLTDPDASFMSNLEETMDPNAGPSFRADVLSRIGAWALSHPEEEPDYPEIFSDYFGRLREDYYRQQKSTVAKGIARMLELLGDDRPRDSALSLSANEEEKTRSALAALLGDDDNETSTRGDRHTRDSLREALVLLSKQRY
ncbi:MAG TPA: serine protein kinase PrkA [Nannocystis exedens]|nr:serine protein kinase PrkA [Nannocystis exedens]